MAKATNKTDDRKAVQDKDVPGEGNYSAARRFRKDETDFVERNKDKIPGMGKAAEDALDGKEGEELRKAEDRARSHSHAQGKNDR